MIEEPAPHLMRGVSGICKKMPGGPGDSRFSERDRSAQARPTAVECAGRHHRRSAAHRGRGRRRNWRGRWRGGRSLAPWPAADFGGAASADLRLGSRLATPARGLRLWRSVLRCCGFAQAAPWWPCEIAAAVSSRRVCSATCSAGFSVFDENRLPKKLPAGRAAGLSDAAIAIWRSQARASPAPRCRMAGAPASSGSRGGRTVAGMVPGGVLTNRSPPAARPPI